MSVMKTNPGGCSKFVDVEGLSGCACFFCAGGPVRHAGSEHLLNRAMGGTRRLGMVSTLFFTLLWVMPPRRSLGCRIPGCLPWTAPVRNRIA